MLPYPGSLTLRIGGIMRFRRSGQITTKTELGRYSLPDLGYFYSNLGWGTGPFPHTGVQSDCTDVVSSSGWSTRMRLGQIVNNYCLIERTEHDAGTEKFFSWDLPDGRTAKMNGFFAAHVAAWEPAYQGLISGGSLAEWRRQAFRNYAILRAYANISDATINAPEIAKEWRSTIKLVTAPLDGCRRITDWFTKDLTKIRFWANSELRRAGRGKARRLLVEESIKTRTANLWLKARMGYFPLVTDILAVSDTLNQIQTRNARRIRIARGGVKHAWEGSSDFTHGKNVCGFQYVTGTALYNYKVRANAGVFYTMSESSVIKATAERLGVGSNIGNLWEPIPYSFVADWFVNVGLWLKAHTLPLGCTVLDSFVVTIKEEKLQCMSRGRYRAQVYPQFPVFEEDFGIVTRNKFYYEREPHVPQPAWPVVISRPLKATQLLDAAALLAQSLAKRLARLT